MVSPHVLKLYTIDLCRFGILFGSLGYDGRYHSLLYGSAWGMWFFGHMVRF